MDLLNWPRTLRTHARKRPGILIVALTIGAITLILRGFLPRIGERLADRVTGGSPKVQSAPQPFPNEPSDDPPVPPHAQTQDSQHLDQEPQKTPPPPGHKPQEDDDLKKTHNNLASNGPVAEKEPPGDRQPVQVYAEGFSFETAGCRSDRSLLVCNVVIANTREDRKLLIYGDGGSHGGRLSQPSRIVDHGGGEYVVRGTLLGKWRLATDVPMNLQLVFEKIPSDIRGIRLLEISCLVGYHKFTAQLRDVPLLR